MAEETAIEWTDATVNFWWGCTKVGPGCDHCYAEAWAKRTGHSVFGHGVPRRKIKGALALIDRLHRGASCFHAENSRRRRVFVQSMADLFDNEIPVEWLAEAWRAIVESDGLDIQIVTKRLSLVERRLAAAGVAGWPAHAGLVISVVDQDEANRDVPRLLALKKRMGIPWVGLSMEPLLGPVDLTMLPGDGCTIDALDGSKMAGGAFASSPRLDWVIVGGESGPGARPMHPDWVISLRDQCAAAGVPFLFKQWGEFLPVHVDDLHWTGIEFRRVGKKAAGRRLHGTTHTEFPA